jgi:hypothetical protein
MSTKVRLCALMLAALFVLSAVTMLAPTALAQQRLSVQPTMKISPLNPQSQEVVVSPSSLGSALFNAIVTVTKPPAVGIVTVQLDGSCSTGWTVVVSPPVIPVTSPGDTLITITVVVPQATPSKMICRLSITGTATYPGGATTAASSGVVTVSQYFRLNPQSQQPFLILAPGSQATLQLDIYNRGNGPDTVSMDLTNLKDIKEKGWTVAASAYSIESVRAGEYDSMRITVKPKKPWLVSYKNGDVGFIELRVKSDHAEMQDKMIEKNFVFAILQQGWYLPGYDITFVIMAFGMMAAYMARRRGLLRRK